MNLALARNEGAFGWGVLSENLHRELAKKIRVNKLEYSDTPRTIKGKVLHAVADLTFRSVHPVRGDYNAGFCFFEMQLREDSIRNAHHYDHIFCGSEYNKRELALNDVFHTSVLIQGVDRAVFNKIDKPKDPKWRDKFVLFSGGKYELRKGQDLVLAAFKVLSQKYDDIHLFTCWENMWPDSIATMQAGRVKYVHVDGSWMDKIHAIYMVNHLPMGRIETFPIIAQRQMRDIFRNTDLGVFPNRCEGGTNLALMEYMACGKPVVASYQTGHKDILSDSNAILVKDATFSPLKADGKVVANWPEPSFDELVDRIEWAYHHREELQTYGNAAAQSMKQYTWEKCADQIVSHMNGVDDPLHLSQRHTLGNLLTRMGLTGEGAEIGVQRGILSAYINARWKGKMLHLIDRWQTEDGYRDIANVSQAQQDSNYAEVYQLFSGRPDANIIKADSVEASRQFEDRQLDWVYVDADHSYEGCKRDIEVWTPKVRVGGLVSGHDFTDGDFPIGKFGVKTAVEEYVKAGGYKLRLSADEANPLRSWYFVKEH